MAKMKIPSVDKCTATTELLENDTNTSENTLAVLQLTIPLRPSNSTLRYTSTEMQASICSTKDKHSYKSLHHHNT